MTSRPPRAPGHRNHLAEILHEGTFAIASFRARRPAGSDLAIPGRLTAYTDDHQVVAPGLALVDKRYARRSSTE
jgi:hypothetical protein